MIGLTNALNESPMTPSMATLPPPKESALVVGLGRLNPVFVSGFDAEGIAASATDNAEEAVELVRNLHPELVLLGAGTGRPPHRLVGDVRAAWPAARTIFLLEEPDAGAALELLESGAHDVVAPPHSVASVVFRARLLEGRRASGNGVFADGAVGLITVDRRSRTILDPEEPRALTRREFELLERLIGQEGRVVLREDLLRDIWGSEQSSEAVLDATVHRLRRKLEVDPGRPRILRTVRGIGYRLQAGRVLIAHA